MLTRERKALLLDRLSVEGRLVAATLAVELQVSEDTILRELVAEGLLTRVHSGALPASPTHPPLGRARGHADGGQGPARPTSRRTDLA